MALRITSITIISFLLASESSTKSVDFLTCVGVKPGGMPAYEEHKKYVKPDQGELDKAQQELNKKVEVLTQDLMYHFLKRMFNIERRSGLTTWVEVGPGAYKSEIVEYPKNLLVAELKKLLSLKAEKDKRDKDLNSND